MKRYMKENKMIKFLSITCRTSLCDQHVHSFKHIEMVSYQDGDVKKAAAVTICLNSLHKLASLGDEEINNYVVYLDEISSFLEFTHNDTLKTHMKDVYHILMRLLKYCNKVIVSDALIHDNVVNFLKCRKQNNKTLYINNTYQKYKDKKAYRVRDETQFLEKIYSEIEKSNYFLFGSDSCDTITKLYHKCLHKYPEIKDKSLLITAETNLKISDASVDFKNKFVFYSPKITYGIDFNIDEAQNVFIYVKGRTISPYGIFQQCTRTRNIDSVYFYCECWGKDEQFKTIKDVEDQLKECMNHDILNTVCLYFDDDDDYTYLENTFFKLYAYNEYITDVFNTSKYHHFHNILKDEGFILESLYEPKQLEKDTRDELTDLIREITDEQFEEYLNAESKSDSKFDHIGTRVDLLTLDPYDKQLLRMYKDIIMSKYKLEWKNIL